MVGLSVVLETQKEGSQSRTSSSSSSLNKKRPQVINKVTMCTKTPPPPSSSSGSFLDKCFLCKKKLLPAEDIYMYKGDRAFCSVECRHRQIYMDEQEDLQTNRRNNTINNNHHNLLIKY